MKKSMLLLMLLIFLLKLGCKKPDDPFGDDSNIKPKTPVISYIFIENDTKVKIEWEDIKLYTDNNELKTKKYIVYKKGNDSLIEKITMDNYFIDTIEVNEYYEFYVYCEDDNDKRRKS